MKEIILKVPDQKLDLVMQLIEQLGLDVSFGDFDIPEEHKSIVRERINSANTEDIIPWREARTKLQFKSNS